MACLCLASPTKDLAPKGRGPCAWPERPVRTRLQDAELRRHSDALRRKPQLTTSFSATEARAEPRWAPRDTAFEAKRKKAEPRI